MKLFQYIYIYILKVFFPPQEDIMYVMFISFSAALSTTMKHRSSFLKEDGDDTDSLGQFLAI